MTYERHAIWETAGSERSYTELFSWNENNQLAECGLYIQELDNLCEGRHLEELRRNRIEDMTMIAEKIG